MTYLIKKLFQRKSYNKKDFSEFWARADETERDKVIQEALKRAGEDQRETLRKYEKMLEKTAA